MIVRNIKRTDDLNRIAAVYVDSFVQTYQDYVPAVYLETINHEAWLNSVNDHQNFFVMLQDKEVIGTASIGDGVGDDEDCGEILSIYLNHDYVDQGYGRLLLNAMVKELYERGYPQVILWDIKQNKRARKFYEKNGFKITKITRNLNLGNEDFIQVKYVLDIEDNFVMR